MIKHLIISGGGYHVFNLLGMVYQLQKKNIYKIENIKTIYGVSAGAIIGTILCLKMDMDDILNYTINRPWNNDIKFEPNNILNIFDKRGVFDINFMNIIFEKLLLSKNLSIDINLIDFYKYSNIDLHIFAVSCNNLELIKFSYKTHPNLKLIHAIHMSSTLPFIFQPMFYNNTYMVDGGVLNKFPFDLCKENNEEKLGILIKKNFKNIKENSNLVTLYVSFLTNFIFYQNSKNYNEYGNNKNIIIYNAPFFNKNLLINLLNKKEIRKEQIEIGYGIVDNFILNFKI